MADSSTAEETLVWPSEQPPHYWPVAVPSLFWVASTYSRRCQAQHLPFPVVPAVLTERPLERVSLSPSTPLSVPATLTWQHPLTESTPGFLPMHLYPITQKNPPLSCHLHARHPSELLKVPIRGNQMLPLPAAGLPLPHTLS